MTEITRMIWLGDSSDAEHADLRAAGIGAILNVAHDLQGRRGWHDGIEYAQCGLVDGPGNTMASYHAAILKLAALVTGGRKTLCHCHEGKSQSVAVVVCVLHLLEGRRGWDHWRKVVVEKVAASGREIPDDKPHPEHRAAFNRLNWRLLASVMEG